MGHRVQGHYRRYQYAHDDLRPSSHVPVRDIRFPSSRFLLASMTWHHRQALVVATLNAAPFDFVARQKVPATHFTWYVLEQMPVVPLHLFQAVRFGPKTAGEIVREAVLELTYTAHDMAPFARDLGYVDESWRSQAAVRVGRGKTVAPTGQTRCGVLSFVRRYRPRRCTLHLFHLSYCRTSGNGGLWSLPLA